jgi:phosphatidylglycerophosphate synthase
MNRLGDKELSGWSRMQAVMMLGGVLAATAARQAWPVAVLAGLSFSVLFVGGAIHFGSVRGLGAANAVTAVRLLLTLALGCLPHQTPGAVLAAVVGLTFLLDGVDGWVARRFGLSSDFGAHLDMECDALLVLVTDIVLWQGYGLGAWVLGAGLLRYAYVLTLAIVPHRGGDMPRSRLARYAFAALVVLKGAAFLVAPPLRTVLAALGTLVVTLSFARSFYWSFARAPRRG